MGNHTATRARGRGATTTTNRQRPAPGARSPNAHVPGPRPSAKAIRTYMVAQREANALSAHVNASENRLTERYQEMSQAYRKADLSSGKAGAAATRKAQRLQEQVEAIMLERRNDPLVQRWERATDITHAFREKYYGSSMARTVRERPLRMLAQRERQADARRGGVPRGVFGDPFLRTTFAQPIRAFL